MGLKLASLGTLAGKTVNGTSAIASKVKTSVPAATNATKTTFADKAHAIKDAYIDSRQPAAEETPVGFPPPAPMS